jgi:spermidine/putrescine transport system permease protein
MTELTRVTSSPLAGLNTQVRRRRWSVAHLGLPTVGLLAFAFLYLPILVLIFFSFNSGTKMGQWEGFSLRWYESVLQNRQLGAALEVTLWVATFSMIISTILGTIAALAMERHHFPGKLTFDGVLYLPVIIPDIVMALSLLLFFSSVNIPLSRYTILIGHVAFNVSFVAVVIRARLASMDSRLEEAAADLYASPWQAFRRVTMPLLMPGILSGALLAFTLSFDEFVITSFISGQGDTTLPVKIYSMIRFGLKPEINAIAVLVLVASSVLVVASLLMQGKPPAQANQAK